VTFHTTNGEDLKVQFSLTSFVKQLTNKVPIPPHRQLFFSVKSKAFLKITRNTKTKAKQKREKKSSGPQMAFFQSHSMRY